MFVDNSSDPDGSIVSWNWNFGDGGTASTANPSHTYAAAGTYVVALQVSDGIDSSQTSQSVTVTAPAQLMTAAVYPILVDGRKATISIDVLGANGSGVAGAAVQGRWTYLDRRGRTQTVSESGVTGSNGSITFKETYPNGATVENFCVTNVTKAGWTYVPSPITCGLPLD
jgi:xanthomonalisin